MMACLIASLIRAPREVAYFQLQRLRTRLEHRRDTSQLTMRVGTLQIDHTAAEAEGSVAVMRQVIIASLIASIIASRIASLLAFPNCLPNRLPNVPAMCQVIPHEKDALPTDLIRLLMLFQHPPGREKIVETLELMLHSLQVITIDYS